jgi:hypothetical protein
VSDLVVPPDKCTDGRDQGRRPGGWVPSHFGNFAQSGYFGALTISISIPAHVGVTDGMSGMRLIKYSN